MAKMNYFGFQSFMTASFYSVVKTCHSRESRNPGACKYL